MYTLRQDKYNHTRGGNKGLSSSFAGLEYPEQNFPLLQVFMDLPSTKNDINILMSVADERE